MIIFRKNLIWYLKLNDQMRNFLKVDKDLQTSWHIFLLMQMMIQKGQSLLLVVSIVDWAVMEHRCS